MPRVIYVKPYRMLLMERLVMGLLAIGFDRAGRWPSAGPRATVGALVLALLIAGAATDYAFAFWTPTQQRSLREYVRSSFVATSATTYAA